MALESTLPVEDEGGPVQPLGALGAGRPRRSLAEILETAKPFLGSVFGRFRVPPWDREDILQDALLLLVERGEQIQDPATWLVGVVRYKCMRYWRDRRRQLWRAVDAGTLEALGGSSLGKQESAVFRRELTTALARIRGRCRELLELRYLKGCKPPEVAQQLGYQPSSFQKIASRCLGALTQQLCRIGADRERSCQRS
jgi:RNA polymerase sigma factor (sigma-70 family)